MKPETEVSIIMPCYKMGKFLPEALASVAAQTYKAWEIIAVDDADPEATTEAIIDEFKRRHPENRVVFIRHEENKGLGAARNTGIEAARGELVAFLDPDDIWKPHYLEKTVAVFRAKPEASVVATQLALFGVMHGKALKEDSPLEIEPWQIQRFPDSLGLGNFITPSATLVRRAVLVEAGGFSTEESLHYVEDYDLWIRLADAGLKFEFLNETLVRYRRHEGAASTDIRTLRRMEDAITEKHAVFMTRSLRKLLRSLYFRYENLEDRIKGPFRWLRGWGKR